MRPNIEHFTHPCHQLAEVYGSEEFRCDGCKTPGNGPRYRCHTCDFNMHDYCGVCPSTLSTFMHPQHPLQRMVQAQDRPDNRRVCDLCEGNVEGLFYRCTICDFNIHPLCTQLPEHVRHAVDPSHELRLHNSSPAWCVVCESECTSWRYGCGSCDLNIHLECILKRCDSSKTLSRSVPPPQYVYGRPVPHGAYPPYGSCWAQPPPYASYESSPPHYHPSPAPCAAHARALPPHYHPSQTPCAAHAHAPPPHYHLSPTPCAGHAHAPPPPYHPSPTPCAAHAHAPPPPHHPSPTPCAAHAHAPPPPYRPPPTPGAAHAHAPHPCYHPPPTLCAVHPHAPPPCYYPSPTPCAAHVHAPSPSSNAVGPLATPFGAHAHVPPSSTNVVAPPLSYDVHAHNANQPVNEAYGSGKPSKGKRLAKIMYEIVQNLTIGVLLNVIFGLST